MTGLNPPTRGRPRINPLPLPQAVSVIQDDDDLSSLVDAPDEAPSERMQARPAMREEDSRARAARRALEIRDHLRGDEAPEALWEFDLPAGIVPDGWVYEWKTYEVYGARNLTHEVELAQSGWDAIPASRHPEMMPQGGDYKTIDRKGQRLMEIPKEIYSARKLQEQREARKQVSDKEESLGATPDGQMQRQKSNGESLVKIGKGYEPIQIPEIV